MNRDTELPDGFQDADFDQRELEAAGALTAALRRRGICGHGWLMAAGCRGLSHYLRRVR